MEQPENPSTNPTGRKLYELTVRDAATANLLTLLNDPDFVWEEPESRLPDNDDASEILSWAFWALLIATPLVSLFLIGLFFGSGN